MNKRHKLHRIKAIQLSKKEIAMCLKVFSVNLHVTKKTKACCNLDAKAFQEMLDIERNNIRQYTKLLNRKDRDHVKMFWDFKKYPFTDIAEIPGISMN